MFTASSFAQTRKMNQYIVNDVSGCNPVQLIMKVYDFALMNCQKHDLIKTNEALQVLINALNFDNEAAKQVSNGLLKLYVYCQESMRKKQYVEVYKILSELRDSWKSALQNR